MNNDAKKIIAGSREIINAGICGYAAAAAPIPIPNPNANVAVRGMIYSGCDKTAPHFWAAADKAAEKIGRREYENIRSGSFLSGPK